MAAAAPPGTGPWRLAARRLRRNRTALVFGGLFLVVAAAAVAAPLWAELAGTDPYRNHTDETVEVRGETRDVVSLDGIPIGPTWEPEFFLGADQNGRDVMVRLLYGARNSLLIGLAAAALTALLSVALGLVAGYLRGVADFAITQLLDVIWSFPVVILAVALGVALAQGGLDVGPLEIGRGAMLIPIVIIGLVYVPYMARPVRGQVLLLREREFVEAARAQGAGPLRIMFREILPNLSSTVVVFFTLMIANAILLEAALSFLGAGLDEREPSWGTMIGDGVDRISTAPHLTIVPGLMLVLAVLGLNVFGDGVRDALDPRAQVRTEL